MKVKLSQSCENWKNFRNQGIINMCVYVYLYLYILQIIKYIYRQKSY